MTTESDVDILKSLKKHRSIIRDSATRLLSVVEEKNHLLISSSYSVEERDDVRVIMSTLSSKREQLAKIDDDIAALWPNDQIETDAKTSSDYLLRINLYELVRL